MEDKKEREEYGFDQIVWKEPESLEEIDLILKSISISDEAIEEDLARREEVEGGEKSDDDAAEISFLKLFEGIDLTQLGDIDG